MYNLFFMAREPKLKDSSMSGKTLWKNPHGYLPGRMAPLLKFYVFMCIAYALLSVVWFSQYVRFREDILQLQHCISLVIGLGLSEMILWYFEYANFNNTGMRPITLTTWVVTIGALRNMISRLLILCVLMGYGVVRPTLGGLTSKVLLLGVTYFLASEWLNITEFVGTINDISGNARALRTKFDKTPSKNAYSYALLLADLFREPDLRFGNFSIIYCRDNPDPKSDAISRVNFDEPKRKVHDVLKLDQQPSKLAFQQLQSHCNQQQ